MCLRVSTWCRKKFLYCTVHTVPYTSNCMSLRRNILDSQAALPELEYTHNLDTKIYTLCITTTIHGRTIISYTCFFLSATISYCRTYYKHLATTFQQSLITVEYHVYHSIEYIPRVSPWSIHGITKQKARIFLPPFAVTLLLLFSLVFFSVLSTFNVTS